jgi:hypothetical protein
MAKKSLSDLNQEKQENKFASYVKSTLNKMGTDIVATGTAMARQGASELGLALKSFPDALGPVDAVGTPYNPTQMQVSQEFGVFGKSASKSEANMAVGHTAETNVDRNIDKEPELEP